MILKTINDDFTSAIDNTTTLTNKIGLFGKSLKDIKAVWDVEGWSGVKNMFSLSITDRDIEKLELYNADVLSGVEPTKALKENLIGASSGAVKLAEGAIQAADGEKKATVETNALKGATNGATASFIGARIAAVALQTAISFGIALAVQGLITAFQELQKLIPNVENTSTWLKESSEKVKTIKIELSDLNDKLTTTQNRLDELKAKGNLTVVEQNEIDKLERLNSELKIQNELKKYSLATEQKETIGNFNKSVTATKEHSNYSDIPWWVNIFDYNGAVATNYLSATHTDESKFKQNIESFNKNGDVDVTWMQNYYDSLQKLKDSLKDSLGDIDYSLLPEDAQESLDYIQDVQNALLIVRDKGKNAQDVFDNIYDSQRFSGAKQSIEELKNSGQLTAETLQNLYNNDTTTNGVKAMISNMQQVGLVTDDSKKSFELLTNQVLQANNAVETVATTEKISFSDLINDDEVKTKIADFETQLSTLSQALEDVRNGNLSNSKFVTLIKKFPELAAHTNDLESAIRNLIETEKTEVNTQFDKWKDKVTDEDISKVNTLNESLKATGDIIDKISTKSLKTVIDDLENVNSKISDIISDYNTNKYLTLENLEDLSNIAPEYLNFLVNENGQISLNTKAYKAYLTSKAKSLLVDNLETLYSTILGMSAEEAQAYKNKKAYDEETDSVKALLTATTQLYYTKAEAKDKENNTTAYTDAMKTAFSTASAYASIFESYINSLSSSQNELSSSTDSATSSTNSLTTALNAEKTALENTKTALENQKTALENTKTGYENAKSSIETLIDWVEKYIKQVKNDEIDALEKKKSAIDDLIDKEKDLLEAEQDEYDWQNTIADKQNTVAKDALAASIASLDDSGAGKKTQKQTAEALATSQKDIVDELYDHSIDKRLDYLDTLKDKQDDYYDKQITAINNYLNDEVQLYKDACSMIDNDNGTLYNKLLTYCKKYTTTTESEFVNMWTSAQTALSSYNTANLGTFNLLNNLQSRIYEVDSAISTVESSISSYSDAIDTIQSKIDNLSSSTESAISKISSLGSSSLGTNNYNLDASQFSNSESSSSSSNNTSNNSSNSSNSNKSSTNNSNKSTTWTPTSSKGGWYITLGKTRYESVAPTLEMAITNLRYQYARDVGVSNANLGLINGNTVRHYAKGTRNAEAGTSELNENGNLETLMKKTPTGDFVIMNQGDQVYTKEQTDNLHDFSSSPSKYIEDSLIKNDLVPLTSEELKNFGAWGDMSQIGINNRTLASATMTNIDNIGKELSQATNIPDNEILNNITIQNTFNGDVTPQMLRLLEEKEQDIIDKSIGKSVRATQNMLLRGRNLR